MVQALSAAYAEAKGGRPLPDRTWRVLMVMALRAMDRDGNTLPAHTYARGWEWLALEALNYPEWSRNNGANRAVARAISDLLERRLIRVAAKQTGGYTRYEILPRA